MERKIGEGHAAAMFRLGLKELRNTFNPSRESVADQEIGVYGTLTQGEIAKARGGPGHGPEQESSADKLSLDDLRTFARELSESQDRGKELGREHDREQERNRERGGLER